MSTRPAYPYDLSDAQWALIEPLLPPGPQPGQVGRPRTVDLREVVNAILYVTRTGCQWNALPHDLPHVRTVYWYHRQWLDGGVWEALTDSLRRQVRAAAGRDPEPAVASIDSQSVKTTERGGGPAMTPASR
jgi:putative transposase